MQLSRLTYDPNRSMFQTTAASLTIDPFWDELATLPIGYARVSADEQTTGLLLDALRAVGCTEIHEDSASGASIKRIFPIKSVSTLRI